MSQFLYRLGRRTAAHPFRTMAAWLVVAVAIFAASGTLGGDPVNDYRVPGVESQSATDTLADGFPDVAGSSGRIVFHVDDGRIDDAAPRAAVAAAVTRLENGPDVSAVSDPFDAVAPTLSPDAAPAGP